MRAVTIRVSEVIGVAGFIHPGNWVDVLATFDQSSGDKMNQSTYTVLQNVQILAIAQDIHPKKSHSRDDNDDEELSDEDDTEKKKKKKKLTKSKRGNKPTSEFAKLVTSVTLGLSPKQAEKLILADEAGSLRLTLRGDGDQAEENKVGTHINDIIQSKSTAPHHNSPKQPKRRPYRSVASPTHYGETVEFYDGSSKSTVQF